MGNIGKKVIIFNYFPFVVSRGKFPKGAFTPNAAAFRSWSVDMPARSRTSMARFTASSPTVALISCKIELPEREKYGPLKGKNRGVINKKT